MMWRQQHRHWRNNYALSWMLIALSRMRDQFYCTAWQNVSAPGDIRRIVSRIFENSILSFCASFVIKEAVLGQIFLIDFHFSEATNCCRHRRWYISWYVASAPLLPGHIKFFQIPEPFSRILKHDKYSTCMPVSRWWLWQWTQLRLLNGFQSNLVLLHAH